LGGGEVNHIGKKSIYKKKENQSKSERGEGTSGRGPNLEGKKTNHPKVLDSKERESKNEGQFRLKEGEGRPGHPHEKK